MAPMHIIPTDDRTARDERARHAATVRAAIRADRRRIRHTAIGRTTGAAAVRRDRPPVVDALVRTPT